MSEKYYYLHKKMKVKELKIEVSEMKEWTKPYDEIVCPKGKRLIKFSELMFIWENEKYRKILFKEYLENPSWILIWCEQLWNDKLKNRSRWLSLGRDLVLGSNWCSLDNSDSDGRVVFVKELK